MIKKFNQFISESGPSEYLLYYAFDWDDNILFMPTVIHMERKEGMSGFPKMFLRLNLLRLDLIKKIIDC